MNNKIQAVSFNIPAKHFEYAKKLLTNWRLEEGGWYDGNDGWYYSGKLDQETLLMISLLGIEIFNGDGEDDE
jgi:hypothetical protein